MHDRKFLTAVGAVGLVMGALFLLPQKPTGRYHAKLLILSPCVLSRYNQETFSWEKISRGEIRSNDLLATSSEGCEVETEVGALELGPNTVAALEMTTEGWVASVQEGHVAQIGTKRWHIVDPVRHAAPFWFSPGARLGAKRL